MLSNIRRMRRAFRTVAWALILSLLGQSVSVASLPPADAVTEQWLQALRVEQANLATAFDREQLLEALEYDARQIARYVKEQVALQIYPGVLRGVEGTLIGQSGNVHDQALTLAALLKDAGYDAQILVTQLNPDQIQEMLPSIRAPQTVARRASSWDRYPAQVRALKTQIAAAVTPVQEIQTRSRPVAAKLFAALGTKKVERIEQQLRRSLSDSARSYRWVRYRVAAGDPWIDVHPAYPSASGWELAAQSIEADQIASADLQKVGMELWIEDSQGTRHSVSGRWEAPSANLLNQALNLEVVSDGALRSEAWSDPAELFASSNYYFVKINGELAPDLKVFDLNGDVYPAASVQGLNTIFSTISQKGRDAAERLGAMGSSDESKTAAKHLARVWVSFYLSAPDRSEVAIHRTLFAGDARAKPEQTAMRLLQRWDLSVANTNATEDYYRHESAKQLEAGIRGFQKFRRFSESKQANTSDEQVLERYVELMPNNQQHQLSDLRRLFDYFEPPAQVVSYRPQPQLLAIRQGLSGADGDWRRYEMTDIVSNESWSFEIENQTLKPRIDTTVERGVWETKAETLLLPSAADAARWESAYGKLATSTQHSIRSASAEVGLRESSVNQQAGPHAWWQVSETSGSVVGMIALPQGVGGATAVEYTIKLVVLGIGLLLAATGAYSCTQGGGEITCCLASNGLIFLYSVVLAWSVGLMAVAVAGAEVAGVGASVVMMSVDGLSLFIPVDCQQN